MMMKRKMMAARTQMRTTMMMGAMVMILKKSKNIFLFLTNRVTNYNTLTIILLNQIFLFILSFPSLSLTNIVVTVLRETKII